jgi:hypothetical protein
VQIPLNYSFRLLHAVVHYLFSADAPPTSRNPHSSNPSDTMPPSVSRHRFEIYTQVECGETNKNEGVIEVGRMVAQLSEDSENESGAADLSITTEQAKETSKTWTWWDEEHSKLAFLFPKGPDLSRGIIYVRMRFLAIRFMTEVPSLRGRIPTVIPTYPSILLSILESSPADEAPEIYPTFSAWTVTYPVLCLLSLDLHQIYLLCRNRSGISFHHPVALER